MKQKKANYQRQDEVLYALDGIIKHNKFLNSQKTGHFYSTISIN